MSSALPRPPYDPEITPVLAQTDRPTTFTIEMVLALHANPSLMPANPPIQEVIGDRPIIHVERRAPGFDVSDPEITLSIFTPDSKTGRPRPCIYFVHGGGMVFMDRFAGVNNALRWIADTDAIVVSVEYRLAPENPHPAPVNDTYAGLRWVSEHATELGIDPERIMLMGQSGGGGIAAGVALMCRDRNGPKLCAQFLNCPMLDDRNTTVSSQQYVDEGTWSRGSNLMAWNAVLEGKAGTEGVSMYAAPGRAEDLSGLPNTFINVGSAEVFRDENVAYASRLWAAGVQADLHVYGGGFHGFDSIPNTRLSNISISVQTQWVKNVLAFTDEPGKN
ncbi:Alpha/Beta hydrolase protein [Ilyonectria destructans]|nr:Alpha/Beta hydrolase protein [Ilyonectria destructans]